MQQAGGRGGLVIRPGQSILDALTEEHDRALDKSDHESKERFSRRVCQCCGKDTSKAECICAGLEWYQVEAGGRIECAAHRFKHLLERELEQERQKSHIWQFWRR